MNIDILLEKIDYKIKKKIYLSELTIKDYLHLIDEFDEDDFALQRTFLGYKSYKRLILDMLFGSDIPSISLVNRTDTLITQDNKIDISDKKFLILDGLQRTSCLKIAIDIIKNPHNYRSFFENFSTEISIDTLPDLEKFYNYKITIFIWENLELNEMLYKMVVLNTGQRKMSNEHQLDILASEIGDNIQETDIRLITDKEIKMSGITTKVVMQSGDLILSTLSEAIVSYIKESPVKNKTDAVEFLFERLTEYKGLLNNYLIQDLNQTIRIHKKFFIEEDTKRTYYFSHYEPLIIGFMSALGKARQKISNEELEEKLIYLENNIINNDWNHFINMYKKFKSAIGYKRRHFSFNLFYEYFIDRGINPLDIELAYSKSY